MRVFLLIPVLSLLLSACREPKGKNSAYSYPVLISEDSLRLAYSVRGTGDTCLLFLHGWGIDQSFWENQVVFFEQKYKVVTTDLAGFGQSDTGRQVYTIEQYANDVNQLIELLNLTHVILVGHSMSGDIVLETAVRFPDRIEGIAGVDNFKDAGHVLSAEEEEEVVAFLALLRTDYPTVAAGYASEYLFHPSTDSATRRKVTRAVSNSNPAAGISSLEQVFAYTAKEKDQLSRLRLPLYLLNSDATATDENALTKYCGNSYRLFTVPATGHYPMLEAPEVFNKQLQAVIHAIGSHDQPR